MTIYPDWCKVKCPTCLAGYNEPCKATLTLPKGVTLRHPHAARLMAYEKTFIGTSSHPSRMPGNTNTNTKNKYTYDKGTRNEP